MIDPRIVNQILDLLIINGQATQEELAAVTPQYMDALAAINREAVEAGDPKPIFGEKRGEKIVFVYDPAGRGTSAPPSRLHKQPGEKSPAEEAPAARPAQKIPPRIDGPAEAPRSSKPSLPDPPGRPSGPSKTPTVTVLGVTNFRLTSSGGRTKITAIPADDASAALALKVSAENKGRLWIVIGSDGEMPQTFLEEVAKTYRAQNRAETGKQATAGAAGGPIAGDPDPQDGRKPYTAPRSHLEGAQMAAQEQAVLDAAREAEAAEAAAGAAPSTKTKDQIRGELADQAGAEIPQHIADATASLMDASAAAGAQKPERRI